MPVRKPKTLFTMCKLSDAGIRQRKADGYFDVTAMCKVCEKDWHDYTELRKTEKFLALLSEELKLEAETLVEPKNKLGEIWAHPQVAVNFAQWADPELAVKVPQWAFDWKHKKLKIEEEFDDIDPEFDSWMDKAVKFDPRKK